MRKTHTAAVEKIIIENGAIGHLPKCINEYNGKKHLYLQILIPITRREKKSAAFLTKAASNTANTFSAKCL